MVVLQQMLVFFAMILLGVVARKWGMINAGNQRQLSSLVINLTSPALIVASAANGGERMDNGEAIAVLGISTGILLFTILIAEFLPVVLRFPKNERGAVSLITGIG